jgi:exonuclease III
MRIATWNIERLKHRKRLSEIIKEIDKVAADILILTEADETVKLPQAKPKRFNASGYRGK